MKLGHILIIITIMAFSSCQQKEDAIDQVTILKERFDGKYKIISSVSHEALDLNGDGSESTDMLLEHPLLNESLVIITIDEAKSPHNESSFIFVHHWPRQEFAPEEPAYDNSDKTAYYSMKVVYHFFEFDQHISRIQLKTEDENMDENHIAFPPGFIIIDEDDRIEVTHKKRIHSSKGWKEVTFTSKYERFN